MSIGEQQRLAFVRLFALFKYSPDQAKKALVMFDESTSAIDTTTETMIYRVLNEFHIWYVTISHRSSLIKYHQKELKLYSPSIHNRQNQLSLNNTIDLPADKGDSTSIEVDENVADETQLTNISTNGHASGFAEVNTSASWLKQVKDVWKLIHLPFTSNDRKIRIQVSFVRQEICSIALVFTSILSLSRRMCVGGAIYSF